MTLPALAVSAGLSFLFLVLVFRPLELAFPAKRGQRFFLGQYLLWSGLVLWVLTYFRHWLDETMPSQFRRDVAAQPLWLQAIQVVLLSDLLIYWGHRLQHRVSFLWRFHSVHQSAEHL